MSGWTGINTHKADDTRCMVVGCDDKAIYQSATTARHGVSRGYCGVHRGYAVRGEAGRQQDYAGRLEPIGTRRRSGA